MKHTTTKGKEVQHLRALLIGDSKIGKTTSLQGLPQERTVIVSADRSLIPLRNCNFRVIVLENWKDAERIGSILAMAETQEDGNACFEVDGEVYADVACVAIDGLNDINFWCKHHILTVDRPALCMERTKNKRDTPEKIYDDSLGQDDWGTVGTRMTTFLAAISNAPMHVVVTCLSMWKDDKKTGVILRTPALNGALATGCPQYFDLVLHMEARTQGSTERVWRTTNEGIHLCGDASGVLDEFESPSWPHIFNKILKPEPTENTEPTKETDE